MARFNVEVTFEVDATDEEDAFRQVDDYFNDHVGQGRHPTLLEYEMFDGAATPVEATDG